MTFYKNHKEKLELIRSGKLSLADNVKHYLKYIEEQKNLDSTHSSILIKPTH